ncbi:MAG: hypothetical protein ACLR43_04065 [Faecalibacillus faecis]
MSHTINMLAKRNTQKIKALSYCFNRSLIVSTFIFQVFIVDNLYQMKKNYHISTYGSWYTRIENIDEQTQKELKSTAKTILKILLNMVM